MNSCSYFWSLLSSLLLLSPGCCLPPPTGNTVYTEPRAGGELLVTIQVHQVDGSALARQLGDLAGVKVLPDPINEYVSICVEKVPWRFALDRVAQEMFCRIVEMKSDVFRVAGPGCQMPLVFENANIKIALTCLRENLAESFKFRRRYMGMSPVFITSARAKMRAKLLTLSLQRINYACNGLIHAQILQSSLA